MHCGMDREIAMNALNWACFSLATSFLADLPEVFLSEDWVSAWGEARERLELGQLPSHSLCA